MSTPPSAISEATPRIPGRFSMSQRKSTPNVPPPCAVRWVNVCLVLERLAETCHKEALGDGAAHGHGMSLAKRAGSVLDAAPQITGAVLLLISPEERQKKPKQHKNTTPQMDSKAMTRIHRGRHRAAFRSKDSAARGGAYKNLRGRRCSLSAILRAMSA